MQHLKFPIGEFTKPQVITSDHIIQWKKDIIAFPGSLKKLVSDLGVDQLLWQYRPGGWTIRQVVHHCADSHMNSFIRFKLALTETSPVIKPYWENLWAEMPDTVSADINGSLSLLEGLHYRWGILLDNLKEEDFTREFVHPEHGKRFSVAENIGIYAWHSNHHLAHVKQAIKFQGNFDNGGETHFA